MTAKAIDANVKRLHGYVLTTADPVIRQSWINIRDFWINQNGHKVK